MYFLTVHAWCLNYVCLVTFIGGYRIKKVVFPYENSSIHKFQDIGEVTNFKLAYEYIFVTVSLFFLILSHLSSYTIFLRKMLLINLHCLFHTRSNHLFKLNLYQQWI